MYTISLVGDAFERGLQQGRHFRAVIPRVLRQCPSWLGTLTSQEVARFRDNMVIALRRLHPEMVKELEGIARGADMSFDDICLVNFVSAIGALGACTNFIYTETEAGPVLAKTSDIGSDYVFYSLQRVQPETGYAYYAVSWAGCLWAEVGFNSAGLAAGQGSAPTMPGQMGAGIPTLEYPRVILEQCADVTEAVRFCMEVPMAGKGLNIALVDAMGDAAVVEKSGTACAVRRPLMAGETPELGHVAGGVYCTNHFLDAGMQDMVPLPKRGLPDREDTSHRRLIHLAAFFVTHPRPTVSDMAAMLEKRIQDGGLCAMEDPEATTYYKYLVLPLAEEIRVGEGMPCGPVSYKTFRLSDGIDSAPVTTFDQEGEQAR